ncbi:MAG: hypothetical protein ACM3VU_00275 [Arthrospira platensis]
MSLEDIYADLDKIAKHQGKLDEEAVLSAAAILARPRYATSSNSAALLVEDLKQVIEAIPNYPDPQGKPKEKWSSYNLQSYARQYFSLDNPGTTLSYRRMFGRQGDPGGSFGKWMSRGVLFRVAAGLLELEVNDLASAPEATHSHDYRIESVRAIRQIGKSRFASVRDILVYDLSIFRSGRHMLELPVSLPHEGHLSVFACDGPNTRFAVKKTLISMVGGRNFDSIVFEIPQQYVNESVHITVDSKPRVETLRTRFFAKHEHRWRLLREHMMTKYLVTQPVDTLILEVDVYPKKLANQFDWVATSGIDNPHEAGYAGVDDNTLRIENPDIGRTYCLSATAARAVAPR